MSEEIIKILDDLAKRFGIAIDWSSENIMPYLEELFGKFINYELWTSIMWIILAVILIAFGVCLIYKMISIFNTSDDDVVFFGTFFGCAIAIVGIVVLFVQIHDVIACITFPEKILFDFIKNMN